MRSRSSISACFIVLALLAIAPASAITVQGIAFVAEVSPGERIAYNMTATSNANVTEEVHAHVYGMTHDEHGERVGIEPDVMHPYSAAPFLKVTPEVAVVEPGASQLFVLEGVVPEDVGDGGRYAFVSIHASVDEGDMVGFAPEVQIPVFLTIKGSEIIETGEIRDLSISEGDDGGLLATFRFNNTGNYHYKTDGKVVLKDGEGNVVDEVSHSSGSSSLLPTEGRTCVFELAEEVDLAPGTYTVEAIVSKRDGTVLDAEEVTVEV